MIKYYQGLTINNEVEFDFYEILKEFRSGKKLTVKGGLLASLIKQLTEAVLPNHRLLNRLEVVYTVYFIRSLIFRPVLFIGFILVSFPKFLFASEEIFITFSTLVDFKFCTLS